MTDDNALDNDPQNPFGIVAHWVRGESLLDALCSAHAMGTAAEGVEALLGAMNEDWMACGRPRYVLSDSAAALLAATRAPRAASEHLPVPFPCFVVEVPGAWTSMAGVGPLHVLVFRYKTGPRSTARGELSNEDDPEFVNLPLRTMVVGWRKIDRGMFHRSLGDASSDSEWHTRLGQQAPFIVTAEQLDEQGLPSSALEAVRFALNTACMVTTYRQTVARERYPMFRRDKGHCVMRVTPPVDVAVTRQFRDHIRMLLCDHKLAERKQALMHVVRGHWKRQAFGVDKAERKMLWIQPYQRGLQNLGNVVASTVRIGHA